MAKNNDPITKKDFEQLAGMIAEGFAATATKDEVATGFADVHTQLEDIKGAMATKSQVHELDPDPVSREEFAELSEYVQYNHFLITTLYKKLGFKVHLNPREGFSATMKDDEGDT